MADDGSNFDGDDGGLAEREAALKRCARACLAFFPFLFGRRDRSRRDLRARGRRKEKQVSCAERERRE